jgi:hypothetical protein
MRGKRLVFISLTTLIAVIILMGVAAIVAGRL